MRITVVALGTRGDVQPMMALARGLRSAGHDICMVAGSNFERWVRDEGFDFEASIDIEALMRSPKGIEWVERSDNPRKQLSIMRELLLPHGEAMVRPLLKRAATTDVFVSGFVSEPFVQSICEKYGIRQINTLLQPYHATTDADSSMVAVVPRRRNILNYVIGLIGERLVWTVARDSVNQMRTESLGLPPQTPLAYRRASLAMPTIYGFSRHVIPPAPNWNENAHIGGYWFLDEDQDWQPSPELTHFLEAGDPPLYIGFGSMSSSDPAQTVDLVAEALRRINCRAVMISGWSGAEQVPVPDSILMVKRVPHHWLFNRVAGVIHHGGAGTTAAGLRAGKPTLIIPHMSDQPFWGRRVYELGVGAKPIPRHKLTVENLAQGIHTLMKDTSVQAAAHTLGEKIRAEDGVGNTVAIIQRILRG